MGLYSWWDDKIGGILPGGSERTLGTTVKRGYSNLDDILGGALPGAEGATWHKTFGGWFGDVGESAGDALNRTAGAATGLGKLAVPLIILGAGVLLISILNTDAAKTAAKSVKRA